MVMRNSGRPILLAAACAMGAAAVMYSAVALSQTNAWSILQSVHHSAVQAPPPVIQTLPARGPLSEGPSVPAPRAVPNTSNTNPVLQPPAPVAPVIDRCAVSAGPGRALPMCLPAGPQP
jgi:hypothetical protein